MFASKIIGVGSYLPENIVTNSDLEKLMETSDEWITQRSGIKERRWVPDGVSNSDLGVKAAEKAIASAGIKKEEIDMIIYATLSPDHDFPGNGCFLQAKLGLTSIPCFDIRQQCSGFLYGLSMANLYVKSGQYKNILLVGAEIHSRGMDISTKGRDVSVLFGDGAGAAVISRTEAKGTKDSQIFSVHLHAEGIQAKELWLAAPGCGNGHKERLTHEMIDQKMHYPYMNGKKVFVNAIKRMGEAIHEVLNHNNFKIEDVDLFLFHQANMRINEAVGETLKIPSHKVFNTIQKYGNTTAATIPIGMDEAVSAGVLKPGMLVATAAFGSGFTWGSALLRF